MSQALDYDAGLAETCRRRFYLFFLEMWETIEAVELVPNWHIEYICDQLQEVYETWERGEAQADVLINVPPGSTKSTMVTQLFPAWLWVRKPSLRILSSSFTASLSISHSVKTRLCLNSPKFNRLYPGHLTLQDDQNGKTDYRNTALGQRFSTSTGTGGAMGNHADVIIIDDPLDPQAGAGEAGRLAAESHLKTLTTRKTDKARTVTILVMQRIHEKDPAGLWQGSGKPLRHICLPGELTKDAKTQELGKQVRPAELKARYTDGLLDPRRLNRIALAGLKVSLGSYGYAGQVQQLPSPEEGGILKKAWFKTMTWAQFLEVPGAQHAIWNGDLDTAYTADTKNDPTALLIVCYLGQTLYVRFAGEFWLELPALKRKLVEVLPTLGFGRLSKLHIEPKAAGLSVAQELRAMSQLNIVLAPAPVADKTARVNTASPFIEALRVVLLVDAPGAPVGWDDAFISQSAGFPTAAHDDMLDMLTQGIARHNKPKGGGVVC
jgi:predicted phage terminase large subunit-like protein